jgi:SAM-dependent methyltransferase
METTDHARAAYDAMAPIYDEFNAQNDYPLWFSILIPQLERHGLKTGKLLDVACGTGRSFEPMRDHGFSEILGCDISPEMIALAQEKFAGTGVELDVADMRRLPVYSDDGYQLVWALNDPVNYLLDDGDLQLALESMGRNLADDGLLVFDTNTSSLFAASFDPDDGMHRDDRWQWKARGEVDGIWEAEISGEGVATHLHRERHYSVPEVQRTMMNAGLQPVAAMGHREDDSGIHIEDSWDEGRDLKIIHVARR